MATLQELLAQKAALEQQIEGTRREERSAAIAQIKELMAQHDLTVGDLATKANPVRRDGKTGSKVPPKYRNAATGETWSGRGLQPNWLKAALASGRQLSDFAV